MRNNRRPRSPTAEAEDLKSFQCGFESHRGQSIYLLRPTLIDLSGLRFIVETPHIECYYFECAGYARAPSRRLICASVNGVRAPMTMPDLTQKPREAEIRRLITALQH